MIGRLKGRIEGVSSDHAIVDVNGVGYLVHCSASTLALLAGRTEETVLWIDTMVREDMIRLHGFLTTEERDLFRILQSVQGVGAKVALGLLSVGSSSEVAGAIASGNDKFLSKAAGCGPKLASRIAQELKGKVPAHLLSGTVSGGSAPVTEEVRSAVEALVRLGYPEARAAQAIDRAVTQAGDGASSATLIRVGLLSLAS